MNGAKVRGGDGGQESLDSSVDTSFRVYDFPPKIIVDPRGDLTLLLGSDHGNERRSVIVSSDTVRRLSKAWEIIYTREGKRSDWKSRSKRSLRLRHDNPDIMLQIMRIAHSQFGMIAPTLSYRHIVDLAVTSKRYGTNRILIPFLPQWTDPYRERILQPGKEEWLFIAYQFGYEKDYRTLTKHLALNCGADEHGNLVGTGGKLISGVFPEGAINHIKQARIDTILAFLCAAYTLVNNAIQTNQCVAQDHPAHRNQKQPLINNPTTATVTTYTPIDDVERSQCTGINYHSMQRSLTKMGFWPPLHHAGGLRQSASEVAHALSTIQVLKYARMRDADLHAPCNAGKQLADQVQAIMVKVQDPVDTETLCRLAQNGAELIRGETAGLPEQE